MAFQLARPLDSSAPARTSFHAESADIGAWLAGDGLTFDFDAGGENYRYLVSIGGAKSDHMGAGGARDYLFGRAGNDKLFGYAEDDALYGDRGNDLLVGGDGADRLTGGFGNDRLFGGAAADALFGGDGHDLLDEGAGHGMLDGGAGDDTLIGGAGPDAFMVGPMSGHDVIRDFTAGPGMFDHLALHHLRWEDLAFADTADGVLISWEGGSVLLEGVLKSELAQDDFMFADSADLPPAARAPGAPAPERHSISSEGPGGVGNDDLPGDGFDLYADARIAEGLFGFGFTGDEAYRVTVGGEGADVGAGGAEWDHFFGRDGDDIFSGNDGDDILQGDAGADWLSGGAGMDKLDGGSDDDALYGGADADELMGMAGDDWLDAGAGHDMIEGGEGDDFIVGGAGADAFIVDDSSGHDIVFDFEATGDAEGAFDHLALDGIAPGDLTLVDGATRMWGGMSWSGVLVSWNTDFDPEAEGSVLLVGLTRADLRQNDFMFIGEPGFVPGVSDAGSWHIFA